jgi:GNAT superfamily N-acetyltransferase
MTIRRLTGDDDLKLLQVLLRHYADYLRETVGAEHICFPAYAAEMESLWEHYCALLLASVDGEAAGCVALKALPEPGACEMKRLWVEPRFRSLGVGRRLVAEVIAQARREGFEWMYLDTVASAMREAYRLYRQFGFEPVERYNDNPVPGVDFFRLRLGGRDGSAVGY